MRYTTIIDISELQSLYKSTAARLIYLHLCLKAGYHDNDRDLVMISLRNLADATGTTLSATRHAIRLLEKARMISRQGSVIRIRKWIQEQPISTRARTAKQQQQIDEAARRRIEKEQYEREQEIEAARRAALQAQGKDSYMIYYESKLALAEAGDEDARSFCAKNRELYEQHKNNQNR